MALFKWLQNMVIFWVKPVVASSHTACCTSLRAHSVVLTPYLDNHMKRIINEKNRRLAADSTPVERPHQKPVPTTPFRSSHGMSPSQINKNNKSIVTFEINPNNTISRKTVRRSVRPTRVYRPRTPNPEILLAVPTSGSKYSIEYPTPDWFRSTARVDVSVIVPLYKSESVVRDLIATWELKSALKWQIIFVDDHCPNNSKEAVLEAWAHRKHLLKNPIGRIIVSTENKGYGLACNTGAEYATGDYLIFLNADTLVTPGWMEPIVELLRREDIGIVGNLQLKEGGMWDGYIDGAGSEWLWGSGCFEHIGRHSYHQMTLPEPMKPETAPADILVEGEREMVTGCCFGIRNNLFQYTGGFNANYRVGYWEDVELNMFVRELGYKIMFTPKSIIHHKLSHTHSGSHPFTQFNKQYFYNRWVNSGRIDSLVSSKRYAAPPVRSILLRRSGANGDVLIAAGVASALKKKHNGCQILFLTDCPKIIKAHPYIDRVISYEEISDRQFQVFYDLDMVYEYRPYANILTAYAECVGVKKEDCDICVSIELVDVPHGYIAIHAGNTLWAGRNWLTGRFAEIADSLMQDGHKVICIGGKSDGLVPCNLDLRGETNFAQLAHVLQHSMLFVGIDSLPMHIAQAVNTPGVCFFGSVSPASRVFRDNMHGVTADLPCLGCHHRKPTPCVFTNICEVGGEGCIHEVSTNMMMSKITEVMESFTPLQQMT